ncbi:MAG: DciA family protein [Wenzhouxiangellaceae bacterium]|nr:DciA family protein [Wenzhouxiangellaceae bacterium]
MAKSETRTSRGRSWEQLDGIARGNSGLAKVLRQAESYIALNRRIRDRLPESVRGEIGVARVSGACLVIAAASPARATQARMLASALLQAAANDWPDELTETRIIVVPGIRFER